MLLKEPFEVKKEYRQSYDPKKDDFNKVVAAIDRGRLLSTLYEYIEIMIMSSSCGPNDRYSYTYIELHTCMKLIVLESSDPYSILSRQRYKVKTTVPDLTSHMCHCPILIASYSYMHSATNFFLLLAW